jgi:hypothetical protein
MERSGIEGRLIPMLELFTGIYFASSVHPTAIKPASLKSYQGLNYYFSKTFFVSDDCDIMLKKSIALAKSCNKNNLRMILKRILSLQITKKL